MHACVAIESSISVRSGIAIGNMPANKACRSYNAAALRFRSTMNLNSAEPLKVSDATLASLSVLMSSFRSTCPVSAVVDKYFKRRRLLFVSLQCSLLSLYRRYSFYGFKSPLQL